MTTEMLYPDTPLEISITHFNGPPYLFEPFKEMFQSVFLMVWLFVGESVHVKILMVELRGEDT